MPRTLSWLFFLGAALSACASEPATSATSRGAVAEFTSSTTGETAPIPEPPGFEGELGYEIVATYPHQPTSYTQGLEFLANGQLVESFGLNGESGRAIVDLETGEHLSFEPLSDDYFGEGITQVEDKLIQLTWLSETAIVASSETLAEERTFSYSGQGWGLCWTGTELAMSDGSSDLTFRDSSNFSELRRVSVTAQNRTLLGQFNELECVGDQIWANVFQENHIVAIDAQSGDVEAWVDLSALESEELRNNAETDDVLNGIAFRPETGTFFVTGKLWPEMYELRFVTG